MHVSAISSPSLLGSYADSDNGTENGINGNSTYLAVADITGVELLNIENMSNITKIAEYREPYITGVRDIIMKENYLYAAGGYRGFFILEIKEIIEPPEETNYNLLTALALVIVISLGNKKRKHFKNSKVS